MLIDLDILQTNIATMAAFFRDRPCKLRPHVKTHRAPAVARMQIAAGATGVTCAKVGMAEAMVDGGIGDVYIANQVVSRPAVERLARLAQRSKVAVAADSFENVIDLSAAAQAFGVTLHVLVEVDAGMRRCGTAPGAPTLDLARAISRAPGLHFAGLHTYEGHVVQAADRTLCKTETEKMLAIVMETKDLVERNGLPVEVVTCGGTGTYDISGVYPGVTEHQSGSYAYMDPYYQSLTPAFGLAQSVLSTVLSRPSPERVITDAGIQVMARDNNTPTVKGHPELYIRGLSEEHGNLLVHEGQTTDLRVGDQLEMHPGHCCTGANLHDRVYAVRNGVVEAVWLATGRGRSQ